MSERLGRPVSYGLGWSYLVKLKHSPQLPRPQHGFADPEEQETFKKTSTPLKSSCHRLSPRQGRTVGNG